MRKLMLLLLVILLLGCTAAQAEVQRSDLLDAAFSLLEKDNIFLTRYNEITGANIEVVFETGVPYFFGGQYPEKTFSKLPDFATRKCWENTRFFRKNKYYIMGFDCSGYSRWVYSEVGLPEHDSLSKMIGEKHADHHLYSHRKGKEMPPYNELKDHLVVGDLLVAKQRARHIMIYIGTLKDYGFTAEEIPLLADYLDYPLVIHCGPNPQYTERIQKLIDENPDKYKKCRTTDGGVSVSIVGVPVDKAPYHEEIKNVHEHDYFLLNNDQTILLIYDLPSCSSFVWYRM